MADRRCEEATAVPRKWVERVKAEKEVEVWPTQRERTEGTEPNRILELSVESPRTLSSRRGLCLAHTAQ
jgi:hypothetical protein